MPLTVEGKKSLLIVDGNHIRISSNFIGKIVVPNKIPGVDENRPVRIKLILTCMKKRVEYSSKRGRNGVIEEPVWQDFQFAYVTPGYEGSNRVPFDFIIPDFVEPTNPDQNTGASWQLEVKGRLNGKRFHDKFELKMEEADGVSRGETPGISTLQLIEHCREQKIRFSGSSVVDFPRGRNIIRGLFPMGIGAAAMAIGIATEVFLDAGLIIAFLIGIIGFLFFFLGLLYLSSKWGFYIKSGKLIFNESSIIGKKTLCWTFDQIKKIYAEKSSYTNNVLYYRIRLEDTEGKNHIIGEGIRGFSNANSLAKWFAQSIYPGRSRV
jgi:hypothetical protein